MEACRAASSALLPRMRWRMCLFQLKMEGQKAASATCSGRRDEGREGLS